MIQSVTGLSKTQSLPITPLLPRIIASLRENSSLVIEAPPGAGKTTCVPPAILDAGLSGELEVWVLEPRRLAARMAARRVADERQEKPGDTVGYQVRFEDVSGPRTRLRFLTEGVLSRRLLRDPQLQRAGVVILDEFHERHLQADVALALLRRLQQTTRPDLKLVAMSATLEAAPVAAFLGDCPVLRAEGRQYEVAVEHLPAHDQRPLSEQVAAAVQRLLSEGLDGDVLVFLPGAAEIRRVQTACARLTEANGLLMLPLHGDLPAAEQDRATQPAKQRKLILSTNVAESSVTIDGIVAVIDSGLARIASHTPWSGLPVLSVQRISQASATQRAGRAGRTRPGRCLRLFTAQDFALRPAHDLPEIRRLDLAEAVLELHAADISEPAGFAWFEPPLTESLVAAETLLQRLGLIDNAGHVTETGRRALRFPLHPRLARMLVEAEKRGVLPQACLQAALISERDLRMSQSFSRQHSGSRDDMHTDNPSDLFHLMDLFAAAQRHGCAPDRLRELQLDRGAVLRVERVRQQLLRLCGVQQEAASSHFDEDALLISLLAGYPDRVARRRKQGSDELQLSAGGSARLSAASVVRTAEFMVAVDIEERPDTARQSQQQQTAIVRLASRIEPDWLLDLCSASLRERTEAVWQQRAERGETVSRLLYDQLVISENRTTTTSDEQVAELLSEAAMNAGLESFIAEDELKAFYARVEFVARTFPTAEMPELSLADAQAALKKLCAGRRSFAQLRTAIKQGEFIQALQERLTREQMRLLRRMAPERISIAGRRNVRVNYEPGQTPWIASRMQDFFGMRQGPTLAEGRVPIVLHLLAPNQRAVQVTTDLAGFWQRTWPQIRRELQRRYPRHAWPEDPLNASVTRDGKEK